MRTSHRPAIALRKGRFALPLLWLLLAFLALTWSETAAAQTVNYYSNSTTAAIADNNCGGGTLSRTFTVGTSYVVGDVDLGVLADHTYRSDLRITLTSPGGTTVTVMTWSGNVQSGDNLNDLFDDEAAAAITSHNATVTDPLTPVPNPPGTGYSHSFRPSNPLSAFDGQNALGTWTMTICDAVGQDTGNFRRADLIITTLAPSADLSLTKNVSNATPANGAAISYTLAVTNAAGSALTANGVTVLDILPAGFTFVSASGFGSYSSGTGVWTVGTIPPGTTRTLTINGTVNATSGATVTNIAEVSASSAFDFDSTPNNGNPSEDDYASRSFTVTGTRVAGTPPVLICPVGTSLFDWNAISWTAGSVNNNYVLANIGTINFSITNPATWVNDANFGGLSPTNASRNVNSSANDGGFASSERSLHQYIDFATQPQLATTTITLPTAVPGAQFRIFDVDFAANDFADKIIVTGYFGATPVYPTLTNGVANYVAGNVAIGDASSGNTSADGNLVITFSAPIDRIVIDYGNHTTAPANPDGQAIAIHDITFCRPTANLTITKTSSVVSDPSNGTTNPKAIPGAVMRYCILVTNNGSGTATSVNVIDAMPATATYVPASLRSGTSCAGATVVEDDNATGADESDPFGASFAGTTVTATTATLTPASAMAIAFQVTVN